MTADLSRDGLRSMKPAFSFPTRSEDRGMVNLRDNENPFGGAQNRYPDNMALGLAVRYVDALDVVEQTRSDSGTPETLILTRGAGDALDLVFRAFFEPGKDAIAITSPTFRLFDELAAVHGLGLHRIALQGDAFDRLDVEALCALPVKGIVLCDPNNPMGTSLHPDDVSRLLSAFKGLVLIDEAYVEYTKRRSYRHVIHSHPNLVVVRSMSKALGMAGLRLGAAFAQAPLIAAMRKVRLPFALPRPVIEQAHAELADAKRLRAQIDAFITERDRFAALLRGCPNIERVYADAGFVTIRADAALGAHLAHAGFDTVPNPMGWPGYIRISIGTPEINDRVISALTGDVPPSTSR
ncbi:aminotransferase class I/II-fold pyridoxal phosphate-dependent enzyme [Vitiosangium sp. GDMCC 1.1324]|uniref:aminotransferase class I/II-fold pyridoxal phosphate-dependent enzyme n=1 Tax=Vitiosangium sp. (strain GDMCC 1.1324) TaxID=2138576 RepID=UPI000D334A0A|nr:aminotransferase class I/II-fold pyridoxal phosphate-dependent enzyme [Vitiosangium sp. GDMCC 1.1324]PTL75945.1 class I/II aminotransferase [Vitiosangium sp. GDMCC 1.1324]